MKEPPKKLEAIIHEAIIKQPTPPPMIDTSDKKIVNGRIVSKSPIKPYKSIRDTRPPREDLLPTKKKSEPEPTKKNSEPEPEFVEIQRLDP